ncbi:threonine-phosphate decarboxylase CobD [Kozakia baliensis]|uniref:threonine-phosphate decarboxylase CobD n=1 Tax=Kozakia baliensis TaxID=153496 RepID=UPI001D051C54|nr:threonine-phosphate decarboxylase CobD [Kozakia baliensis]
MGELMHEALPPIPTHGGQVQEIMRYFPDAPRPFVDLSTGINPHRYPLTLPSPDIFARLPEADEEDDLRAAAAIAYGAADPAMVVSAPGSQSLISLLPRLVTASRACIWEPTYSGHATAWQQSGVEVQPVSDWRSFERQSVQRGTVCILCNPNNPDGRLLPAAQLRNLADRCASYGNYLVVDEAFADFHEETLVPALPHPALIVLRSFGKIYGLPGLRLGFLLASPDFAERARQFVGAWPVGSLALSVGREALRDREWLQQAHHIASSAKRRLVGILEQAYLQHEGQVSLFTLVITEDAAKLWTHLCRHGIVTRIFNAHHDRLRIGLPGGEEEWARLEQALYMWRDRS